jgi:glycosyltransferase involved in cell wall biosynthesis
MNVLLLTSHMEANPVSILEALAAEKPVVATRVGSVPETVCDGENGYLIPPGDAEALAARTIELFDNRERAEAFGRAGRETVLRHWSIDCMIEGYEQLITEIYEHKLARRVPLSS